MIVIGIPVLDKIENIKRLLGSMDSYWNNELIIIDNGGIVSNYWQDDSCYIERPDKNLGVSPSWNAIIEWALLRDAVEAIFILNDDIELEPGCIDNMYQSLTIMGFDAISASQKVNHNKDWRPFQRYSTGMQFSCFALTPKCIETIGLFDEEYAPAYVEDTDYYHRLEQSNLKFGCDRWAQFIHHKHRNRQSPELKESHNKNRRYFRDKWGVSAKTVFSRMCEGRRV